MLESVDVVVRPYAPSDQAGVEWLYTRTPPSGRSYPRPQPIPEDLKNIETNYEHVLVAVEQDLAGEAVVGLTAARRALHDAEVGVPEFIEANEAARLHHVLVAPERWRKGIGTQLTKTAMAWANKQGYTSLVLDTTADQQGAIAFYMDLGFREVGRTTFVQWEFVWFRLELPATQPRS